MKAGKEAGPRGQLFSGEFLVSFLMFMAAFTLLMGMWDTSTKDLFTEESTNTMEEMTVGALENIVRTPGVPSDWGAENVTSIGLANDSRVLMPDKVKALAHYMADNASDLCTGGTNYECNTHMLGIVGYQFHLNLTYLNGTTVIVNGTLAAAGRNPVNETNKLTVQRTAILNGEITRVYLTVWR
jgi:hypothetical protein